MLKTYTFKIVPKWKDRPDLYTLNKNYEAESILEAHELCRKEYPLGNFNVYATSQKNYEGIQPKSNRERFVEAMLNRTLPGCEE